MYDPASEVEVDFPRTFSHNEYLGTFGLVWHAICTLDERLKRIEVGLLEAQFAKGADDAS